ncbi:MAG: hypothetical protein ACFE8A_11040 [Candidatus Hodarchaeota archaeon]
MGKKEKKKKKLGIKTSRYYTKDCHNCGNEYPNWFTQCPLCGAEWFSSESLNAKAVGKEKELGQKKIKIVVKITEEDFNDDIDYLQLIFSGDQGKSWYQMKMDVEMDYFIAEMAEVPDGSVIIYYIEVYLVNGEKFIENNKGNYFYYKVGALLEEIEEKPPQLEAQIIQENIKEATPDPHTINEAKYEGENTIFGKPQTQIDPDLKICPHCNAKIKKMWGTCPFCSGKV